MGKSGCGATVHDGPFKAYLGVLLHGPLIWTVFPQPCWLFKQNLLEDSSAGPCNEASQDLRM